MLLVKGTVDTRQFDRAMALAFRWSARAPEKIVSDTARGVSFKAMAYTPAVPLERIDEELDVILQAKVGARGKPLSTRYAKNRSYVARRPGVTAEPFAGVPLAWLIIGARAKQTSEYNISTSWRWMIGGGVHPFKGHKVSEFAGIMRDLVSRMVKGRHSSTHFLQAGWGAVTKQLRALRYGRPESESPIPYGVDNNSQLGSLSYGGSGGEFWVKLENRIGMSGPGDALNEKRNRALLDYGTQPLQRAVDEQAREMEARYLPRELAEIEAEWNGVR
jgi:hypothetical protein